MWNKKKKESNYELQIGNILLTMGNNFATITDMPNMLVEHMYHAGSVEYAFINYLLSPTTKDDNGDERKKTQDEIDESKKSIEHLAYLIFSTQLLFINNDILKGYSKLLDKAINKQKVKKETDTTALKEEADLY